MSRTMSRSLAASSPLRSPWDGAERAIGAGVTGSSPLIPGLSVLSMCRLAGAWFEAGQSQSRARIEVFENAAKLSASLTRISSRQHMGCQELPTQSQAPEFGIPAPRDT